MKEGIYTNWVIQSFSGTLKILHKEVEKMKAWTLESNLTGFNSWLLAMSSWANQFLQHHFLYF